MQHNHTEPTEQELLTESLIRALTRWEKLCKRSQDAAEVDYDYCADFAAVLQSVGTTIEELEQAKNYLLAKSKWFPAPSEVIEVVQRYRVYAADAARRAYLASLVNVALPDGTECMMPYPEARRLGLEPNSIEARERLGLPPLAAALPPPVATMSAEALNTYASITQDPRAVAEIIKRKQNSTIT